MIRCEMIWGINGWTYLCGDPQNRGGETEAGRGEEAGVGEVEGEEDQVPEEILRGEKGGG